MIGSRRWDRDGPDARWVESAQTPIPQPRPYWTQSARNAYFVAPGELTFYDPQIPAWFRLRVDPMTARPLELRMTAAAHFMVDRYSGFDRSVDISPPPR